MRLIALGEFGSEEPYALLRGEHTGIVPAEAVVVSLRELARRFDVEVATIRDVLHHLEQMSAWLDTPEATELAEPLGSRRMGAPIPDPRVIVGVGMNYRGHAAALDVPAGDPVIFLKPPGSLCGPYDAIVRPPETSALDHEVELGIVIGRDTHRVSAGEAWGHIAGFLVANDVSARDIALGAGLEHPLSLQLTRAKAFPTFCPTGPWLLTADEVSHALAMDLMLDVNGTARQRSSTADMITGIPELIAYISTAIHMRAGDLILSGSPPGAGFELAPPSFLDPGDVVEAEISGLGRMRSVVVQEDLPEQGSPRHRTEA